MNTIIVSRLASTRKNADVAPKCLSRSLAILRMYGGSVFRAREAEERIRWKKGEKGEKGE